MKIRRKPDLLSILALITLLGVLISSLAQWYVRNNSTDLTRFPAGLQQNLQEKTNELYRGNFVNVSGHVAR